VYRYVPEASNGRHLLALAAVEQPAGKNQEYEGVGGSSVSGGHYAEAEAEDADRPRL